MFDPTSPRSYCRYFADTIERTIFEFDYASSGNFTNRRVFHHSPSRSTPGGLPDGLLVDAQDNIYSARFAGSKIIRFKPSGDADLEIVFDDTRHITACELGGKGGSTLFVTTASLAENGDDKNDELVRRYGARSGAVWAVDLSAEGVTAKERFRFKSVASKAQL